MAILLRRRLWLLVAPLLVAAYALAGFYGVPRIAAKEIRDYTAQVLHRPASVGEIRFNPFTLDAELHDLSVPDADGKPMLGFSRLHVRVGALASLARRGYVVSVIELDGLNAHAIRRSDKSINLMALAPPPKPEPEPEKPGPIPRVFVDSFALRDATVMLDDEARAQALHLKFTPVAFELKDFRTTSEDNSYGFSAKSTRGESLDWHGTFGLQPVESSGTFAIGHLLATTISQVGGDLLPLDISRGEIDVNGSYEFKEATDGAPRIALDIPSVRLRDIGLREHKGSEDWVVVPEIAIDRTKVDLAAQSVDVGSVTIDRPTINAWLDHDGNLNLARLYSTKAAGPEAAPTDKIEKPWHVRLPLAQIRALDARFEDRTTKTPVDVHLSPVDLTVKGFALPLSAPVDLELSAGVNGNGRLRVAGPVGLSPLSAKLAVDVRDVDLPFVQPYLDQHTQLDLLKGALGAKLAVAYAAAPAGKAAPIKVTGDISVHSLHTKDKVLKQDFVNWNLLALKDLSVTTAPFSVSIREIVANQPYARVVIAADQTTNISDVLGTAKKAPAAAEGTVPAAAQAEKAPTATGKNKGKAAPPPTKPVDQPISVHVVRVEDGSMNFADLSVKPNFSTGIQALSGTIRGISGKSGSKADIDLKGKVDRYAPVTIAGTMNLLAADASTDIRLDIRNLELTTFSPYSGKFAGYRVEKGKMSIDFTYHVKDRMLDAKHHLVLDQLELGEKVDSKDATNLPVKFAISLLKDVNGVIDLDLPVNGSLDDPKFRIGPIIWKVFVNLLEKAVTAPFRLLGSLFGGGNPPEMITFVPGSAEIDDSAKSQIETLRKGLAARPALKLDVPMAVCNNADSAAVADAAWSAHVRDLARAKLAGRKGAAAVTNDAVEGYVADPKAYRKLLEESYKSVKGAAPQIPAPAPDADADEAAVAWLEAALKPAVTTPPDALAKLGRERAEGIERLLLDNSGIDPGRIFVVTDKDTGCSDPAFVQLKLALK